MTTSLSPAPSRPALGLPAGWVDRSVVTFVGPDEGDGSPSLVVTSDGLEPGTSMARYAAMQDAAVRAGFDGIELLEDRETTVGGHRAVRRTYRWGYDGRTMRQRTWALVVGDVGYTIVASAPDATFDGLRSAFAAALREFRIE
ncbi:MAG TPA: DcrB-related protein [Gaiellales bacterium]